MSERVFTIEEARALLEEARALAEALRDAHRTMDELHDEVMETVPTNGGGPVHRSFLDASGTAAKATKALEELGVVVRDPANGLLDFPTERDGEQAFLCWRIGEPDIAWWHPTETGFAGRQPL